MTPIVSNRNDSNKRLLITYAGILLMFVPGCQPANDRPLPPANQSPYITKLSVQRQVSTSTEIPVSCTAADPDSDNLTYAWFASGGSIKGQGDIVSWLAPGYPGNYLITVKVDDGKGGAFSQSENITVVENPAKICTLKINGIRVTAPDRKPVVIGIAATKGTGTESNSEITAGTWDTIEIECLAEDQDGHELKYIWSATAGRIHGQGSKVNWTLPGVAGNFSITARVDCSKGESATHVFDSIIKCLSCGAK